MPRQLRIEYPGAIYHLMNRGDWREPIFTVMLDYTGATNPPVVKLIWPQDGMAVSGTFDGSGPSSRPP